MGGRECGREREWEDATMVENRSIVVSVLRTGTVGEGILLNGGNCP